MVWNSFTERYLPHHMGTINITICVTLVTARKLLVDCVRRRIIRTIRSWENDLNNNLFAVWHSFTECNSFSYIKTTIYSLLWSLVARKLQRAFQYEFEKILQKAVFLSNIAGSFFSEKLVFFCLSDTLLREKLFFVNDSLWLVKRNIFYVNDNTVCKKQKIQQKIYIFWIQNKTKNFIAITVNKGLNAYCNNSY